MSETATTIHPRFLGNEESKHMAAKKKPAKKAAAKPAAKKKAAKKGKK